MPDNNLEYKPTSCWKTYSAPHHQKAMDQLAQDYVDFLTRCKTERKVIDYALKRAEKAGFTPDFHSKQCLRVKNGKVIFLARRGKKPLSEGFRFIMAHGDAPRIDFKQHPLYDDSQVAQAKTHYYGGIRKHQWLARPLALHGTVIKTDGTRVDIVLGEDDNDPVFSIADLLPHLAYKQVEQKVSDAFEAEKLNAIVGHAPLKPNGPDDDEEKEDKNGAGIKAHVLKILNERFGIAEADLFSAELQLVPAGAARFVGLDKAIIGGYAHDDRACCFASLEAFLKAEDPEHTQVLILFDKEEVGSEGSTGAKSKFFENCMLDLMDAWEPDARLHHILDKGKAISADVHGALDPDWPELHDKRNAALMGYGPCFSKYTGHRGKVAANDAHPEYVAFLRGVLDGADVPWQMAGLGRVDLGGGGTVAKYLAEYGMDIIDFGPPVLSMHSPFELVSRADMYATVLAFEAFLKS